MKNATKLNPADLEALEAVAPPDSLEVGDTVVLVDGDSYVSCLFGYVAVVESILDPSTFSLKMPEGYRLPAADALDGERVWLGDFPLVDLRRA